MVRHFFQAIFPWITLLHAVLFLAFWLTNGLFYAQTNDYLTEKTGARLDFIRICLLAAVLLALWSIARLALARLGILHRLAPVTAVLFGLCSLVFVAFFYGSFRLLFHESASQLPRIRQLLLYHRLILDFLILAVITLLAAFWLRKSLQLHPATGWGEFLRYSAPAFGLLLLIWAAALIFPPGSIYRGNLPKKPLLIAHRGASFLAPENTLAAAELAASLGVYGLETDLRISLDGIPFLMHDDTLDRTTDVAAVFSGREEDAAENFTLAELLRLNAGQWFLEKDPFRTVARGIVSASQAQSFQRLPVPTLAQELEIVQKNRLVFIFDLKQPPQGHPYREQFFDIVFQQIQAAGIDSQIWFLADSDQARAIRAAAPQMILVHGTDYQQPPQPSELLAQGYQVVNADFSLAPVWVRKYQEAGLWVNLYTVDEPWQFSRLWLLGVDSITSSNAGALQVLQRPVFSLSYSTYLILWITLGIIAAAVLFFLAYLTVSSSI